MVHFRGGISVCVSLCCACVCVVIVTHGRTYSLTSNHVMTAHVSRLFGPPGCEGRGMVPFVVLLPMLVSRGFLSRTLFSHPSQLSLALHTSTDPDTLLVWRCLLSCIFRSDEPKHCKVFNGVGQRILSMGSVEDSERVYVVPQNRNFVWPTIEIGRKVTVPHVKTPQGELFHSPL